MSDPRFHRLADGFSPLGLRLCPKYRPALVGARAGVRRNEPVDEIAAHNDWESLAREVRPDHHVPVFDRVRPTDPPVEFAWLGRRRLFCSKSDFAASDVSGQSVPRGIKYRSEGG